VTSRFNITDRKPTPVSRRTSGDSRVGRAAWLIAACVLGFSSVSSAQQTWTKQAPIPTDRSLDDVFFLTPNHGFVVGRNKSLLETQDGGATWTTRVSGPFGSDPFYAVHFSDALHGFVTGNNSDALRTTDGGKTWEPMTSLFAGSWEQMDFVTPQSGFAGANGACAFTSDAGLTWEIRSAWPTAPVTFGLDYIDENVGLVAGLVPATGADGVFRTADGGRTWTNVLTAITNDVAFLDADTVLATAVVEHMIYRSFDAGVTWLPWAGPFQDDGPLGALFAVDARLVFSISLDGDIWRSDNGGASWLKTWDGISDLPYKWSLMFSDELHGWATGPYGIIIKTTDGGLSWEVVNQGVGRDVNDIEMFDDNYGLAVAENGYMMRTTDGGQHWDLRKLEVTGQIFLRDESFDAVDILDQNFAVAAGPGGTVFKTLDGGESWTSIGFPLLSNSLLIHGVSFVSPLEGWVAGQHISIPHDRTVFHTIDGGLTWDLPFNHNALFIDVQFVDRLHGWLQSASSLQRRTTDGGLSWQDVTLPDHPLRGSPSVKEMSYADSSIGWVVGGGGYIAKTIDGGQTWALQPFPDPKFNAFAVHVMSTSELRVVGQDAQRRNVTYHSTDGGNTWARQMIGFDQNVLTSITAQPSGNVWAAGFRGFIVSNLQTCVADCDQSGVLDIFDFLCFQNSFVNGEPYACNCDTSTGPGMCDIFDFLCFQSAFTTGCP
jgi:photosystem II stability/assembly factor-like uncharacterized protein